MTITLYLYINIIIARIFVKYSRFEVWEIEKIIISKVVIFEKYKNRVD